MTGSGPRASHALTIADRAPRLVLQHPVFATFDYPFFRISEVERKPVLVIRLDDREASLPLAGVVREFGIAPHGEDGIMLGLVARALQFVTGLRIGDRLPSEILTREASWSVDEASRDRALARLNLLLIAWAQGGTPGASTRELLSRAGQVPINADTIAAGLHRLATRIGNVTPDEALARVRQVAGEFAHIDALRDQLLRGAQRLSAVLDRLSRNFRGDGTHKELLMRVRRLAAIGVADLQARFDQADAAVGDITEIVARPDDVIAVLRDRRDGLYVRLRAWEPYIMEWETIEAGANVRTWHLAHDTYRFLAPRFMTMVEWMSAPKEQAAFPTRSKMVW